MSILPLLVIVITALQDQHLTLKKLDFNKPNWKNSYLYIYKNYVGLDTFLTCSKQHLIINLFIKVNVTYLGTICYWIFENITVILQKKNACANRIINRLSRCHTSVSKQETLLRARSQMITLPMSCSLIPIIRSWNILIRFILNKPEVIYSQLLVITKTLLERD